MMPNEAAEIITGTVASPSSPSVRFTALPAPTMTKPPNSTKKMPRSSTKPLTKGNAIEVPSSEPATPVETAARIMK